MTQCYCTHGWLITTAQQILKHEEIFLPGDTCDDDIIELMKYHWMNISTVATWCSYDYRCNVLTELYEQEIKKKCLIYYEWVQRNC